MAVTLERIDAAIDMLISMVVMDLAHEQGRSATELMPEFLSSRTARQLYDEEQKLWCEGPAYIEEMYKQEKLEDG